MNLSVLIISGNTIFHFAPVMAESGSDPNTDFKDASCYG